MHFNFATSMNDVAEFMNGLFDQNRSKDFEVLTPKGVKSINYVEGVSLNDFIAGDGTKDPTLAIKNIYRNPLVNLDKRHPAYNCSPISSAELEFQIRNYFEYCIEIRNYRDTKTLGYKFSLNLKKKLILKEKDKQEYYEIHLSKLKVTQEDQYLEAAWNEDNQFYQNHFLGSPPVESLITYTGSIRPLPLPDFISMEAIGIDWSEDILIPVT